MQRQTGKSNEQRYQDEWGVLAQEHDLDLIVTAFIYHFFERYY